MCKNNGTKVVEIKGKTIEGEKIHEFVQTIICIGNLKNNAINVKTTQIRSLSALSHSLLSWG